MQTQQVSEMVNFCSEKMWLAVWVDVVGSLRRCGWQSEMWLAVWVDVVGSLRRCGWQSEKMWLAVWVDVVGSLRRLIHPIIVITLAA
jgi:hypothetical protein